MKYKYRTGLYKCLSILPDRLGYFIYHLIQQKLTKSDISLKIAEGERSFGTIKAILDKNNINLENSRIVEIGSGWVPLIPYLLVLNGKADKVDTYDINEHFNIAEIDYTNRHYKIPEQETALHGRYRLLDKVHYFPKCDVVSGDLADADLVLSRFVMEHVPPEIIRSMHESLFRKLKPGSHILHLISPSDHRAYSDASLSLVDFLQYSSSEWDAIQTKFDYHNRLRLPQYLDILSGHFEILYLEYDWSKPGMAAYDKFKNLQIHPDFAGFSDVELTAGSINVLLKKK